MNEPAASEPAALVVRALADGRCRSRAALARECGIGEADVEAALSQLPLLGVELIVGPDAVALPRPVDLLDAGTILASEPRLGPDAIHVRFAVDSTNTVLAERLRAGAAAPELCAARSRPRDGAGTDGAGSRVWGRAWCCPSPGASPCGRRG